ncbi:MAG: amidohydrolase family protein [Promethearchaeota archaeon]
MYQRIEDPKLIVFVNVNIVPMDSERVIENQTVIVKNGKIETIANSDDVSIPTEAFVIDGQGKYLMPGLADMHTQITSQNDLLLLIASGVTTVRNMTDNSMLIRPFGFPGILKLSKKIADDKILGPTIYTTGTILEGKEVKNPIVRIMRSFKDTERIVAKQKARGYDFIKIHNQLSKEAYNTVINAAKKQNIPVIGHVPYKVAIDKALEDMFSIEQLTGFIDYNKAKFAIPQDKIKHYAKKTKEAGIWNCPTVSAWQKIVPAERANDLEEFDIFRKNQYFRRKTLIESTKTRMQNDPNYRNTISEITIKMTKALHEAGAKLVLGTGMDKDILPGFSVYDELKYLVEAGLTPYEAILAGTRKAAECLNKSDEFGTVSVGKRADLILLNNNPLDDIEHIKNFEGVMVRGRWLPREELNEMLARIG